MDVSGRLVNAKMRKHAITAQLSDANLSPEMRQILCKDADNWQLQIALLEIMENVEIPFSNS